GGVHLGPEAAAELLVGGEVGAHHLDRHPAAAGIAGEVDRAHPAGTQATDQRVTTDDSGFVRLQWLARRTGCTRPVRPRGCAVVMAPPWVSAFPPTGRRSPASILPYRPSPLTTARRQDDFWWQSALPPVGPAAPGSRLPRDDRKSPSRRGDVRT